MLTEKSLSLYFTIQISTSTTWYISQLMRLRVMHNISNVFFLFFFNEIKWRKNYKTFEIFMIVSHRNNLERIIVA